jgi:peptidoglycan/xylan/chitin deacetylase (PgdA/CDA1 family)
MKIFKTPRFFKWIFPRRTWGFSRSKNQVFLTFDDGPNPEITPWVLDYLKEKNILATFFCVGTNILKYPELFERIKLEGHSVGNHTMNHEKATKVSFQAYKKSISETEKLVQNKLFRPPYGRINAWQSYTLSKRYQLIMWSWLSYDFDKSVEISTILQKAEQQIKAGDILVLHDNVKVKERIKLLLPELIKKIEKKGLNFCLIQESI